MHGVGTEVQPILHYPNLCTCAAASAQRKHLFPICTKVPEKPATSVLNKALHSLASCFLSDFIHSFTLFQQHWPPRSSSTTPHTFLPRASASAAPSYLTGLPPDIHTAHFLASFSLDKMSFFFSRDFSDHLIKHCNPTSHSFLLLIFLHNTCLYLVHDII